MNRAWSIGFNLFNVFWNSLLFGWWFYLRKPLLMGLCALPVVVSMSNLKRHFHETLRED
jgi:hypothetical protein